MSAQLRSGESDWTGVYDETIALAVEAEKLGMSSIWTTEHHFIDDGYMPSLLVVSAAIAAATERIEIGTGVVLAPLHHPLRLAEDAATASLLSHGRFSLGLGLGWLEAEFSGFGASTRQRGAAMEEILDILPKAWSGEPFHHVGRIYSFPPLAVRPRPTSPPPVLIGGGAEPAIRRAARLADGLFSNATGEGFVRQVSWLIDECDRIGRDPAELRVVHYSVMLPGDDASSAMDRYGPHVWHMMWKYSDMEASTVRSGTPPSAPPFTEERRESLQARSTLAGSTEQIVTELGELRERVELPVEFVARSYLSTLEHEEQLELMSVLATEVAPHV